MEVSKRNEEKMTFYKICRPILGTIYKLWYNPKIIGRENIPLDGPIILVGNHIHIMDQCNVIIVTKRCIHYMAKKEYFDKQYKEGKFAWFFRSAGCIPVDRSKKDTDAVDSALEVLNNYQALGLFPEGTRNALKEARIKEIYDYYMSERLEYNEFLEKAKNNRTSQVDYLEELLNNKIITRDEFKDNVCNVDDFLNDLVLNKRITREDYIDHILLPFKFGAVSMASKTSARIVPFAVTGDYKFRSKNLMIRIGEPLEAMDDLEVANERLEKAVKDLIKENLKK